MKPEIVIEYCAAWNYEPQAVGLAAQLLGLKFKIGSLKLIPSTGGVFEVSLNGRSVYSKKATGEFPDPAAILRAIEVALK